MKVRKKINWTLNLRWILLLGGSGLILGLFFAVIAHYLTLSLRNFLLEKQINLMKEIHQKDLKSREGLEKLVRQSEGKIAILNEDGNFYLPNLLKNFPINQEDIKREIQKHSQRDWFSFTQNHTLFLVFTLKENKKVQNYLIMNHGYDNSLRLILVYYVLALLLAALLALLAMVLASEIIRGLTLVERALLGQTESPRKLPFGELEKFLDNLNKRFTFQGTSESISWEKEKLAGLQNIMRSENQEILTYLQKILFEKPFPRLKHYEIALYPKNPSPHAENIITAREKQNQVEIFAARFDLSDIEANLWKHRLQEKFLSLMEVDIPVEKRIESLWQTLFAHVDLGPGLLYITLGPDGGKIYRGGSFYLFTYQNNQWEVLQSGETFFSSNFSKDDISEFPLVEGILVITQDIVDLLEMDTEQTVTFLNQNLTPPAKNMVLKLAQKLQPKIHAQEGQELTGFILACSKK